MINYHNKIFRPISNTENGETSESTVFKYQQDGSIVRSEYSGGIRSKALFVIIIIEITLCTILVSGTFPRDLLRALISACAISLNCFKVRN